jgi:glycosyltransferase involved in cell wall biosynthesis
MRVLAWGTYERGYPRNAQVLSALRGAGVAVEEWHVPLLEGREHKHAVGVARGAAAAGRAEARLLAKRPPAGFDALLVGYPGTLDMVAARRAARGRPIVFNCLLSLFDTFVADRGRFRATSAPARALRGLDRYALRRADLVVADTDENARFLERLAGIDGVATCLVGAEDRLFRPGPPPPAERFHVLFVGKLIPLHGLETILEAAWLAPEIPFRIVGSGQLDALMRDLPANVEHVPWVAYEELPAELHRAGAAVGVFGRSEKARRVIPNKAFQALACATPLVTADTPAARELLRDGESALLVPPADAAALAETVRRLAADVRLRAHIGAGGRATYEARASEAVLGARWRTLLEELCA